MIKLLKAFSHHGGFPNIRCKVYFSERSSDSGMVFERYFKTFNGDECDSSSFIIVFNGFVGRSCYFMHDLDILRIDFEVANKERLLGWVKKCNIRREVHYAN